MSDLTSATRRGQKKGKKSQTNFSAERCHCDTIDDFIKKFGSLKEVKETVKTGKDELGVNEAYEIYLDSLIELVYDSPLFINWE